MKYPKIVIVNAQNEVMGAQQLPEAVKQGLIRQVVRILLINKKGEIYLQQRSKKVMFYPNYWDSSAVGHVDEGETPEQAAQREVQEELGIQDIPLQKIAVYYKEEREPGKEYLLRSVDIIFIGSSDQEIKLNWEVSTGKWFSKKEISEVKPMTPGCKKALEAYHDFLAGKKK